jgi:hypothetical protein
LRWDALIPATGILNHSQAGFKGKRLGGRVVGMGCNGGENKVMREKTDFGKLTTRKGEFHRRDFLFSA